MARAAASSPAAWKPSARSIRSRIVRSVAVASAAQVREHRLAETGQPGEDRQPELARGRRQVADRDQRIPQVDWSNRSGATSATFAVSSASGPPYGTSGMPAVIRSPSSFSCRPIG